MINKMIIILNRSTTWNILFIIIGKLPAGLATIDSREACKVFNYIYTKCKHRKTPL